jgi:hypothetical protein
LKYEEIETSLDSVLPKIRDFLGRDIVQKVLPSRSDVSREDGRWVREKANWADQIAPDEIELFNRINRRSMKKYRYL